MYLKPSPWSTFPEARAISTSFALNLKKNQRKGKINPIVTKLLRFHKIDIQGEDADTIWKKKNNRNNN